MLLATSNPGSSCNNHLHTKPNSWSSLIRKPPRLCQARPSLYIKPNSRNLKEHCRGAGKHAHMMQVLLQQRHYEARCKTATLSRKPLPLQQYCSIWT